MNEINRELKEELRESIASITGQLEAFITSFLSLSSDGIGETNLKLTGNNGKNLIFALFLRFHKGCCWLIDTEVRRRTALAKGRDFWINLECAFPKSGFFSYLCDENGFGGSNSSDSLKAEALFEVVEESIKMREIKEMEREETGKAIKKNTF